MKRIIIISAVLVAIFTFFSCNRSSYSFKYSTDNIKSIEIVLAENSMDYTVMRTLSNDEMNDFLEQFQMIEFNNYYIGDPMTVSGNAVKITYSNESYEIICYRWAEYIECNNIYFVRKSCNEEDFNKIINSFIE